MCGPKEEIGISDIFFSLLICKLYDKVVTTTTGKFYKRTSSLKTKVGCTSLLLVLIKVRTLLGYGFFSTSSATCSSPFFITRNVLSFLCSTRDINRVEWTKLCLMFGTTFFPFGSPWGLNSSTSTLYSFRFHQSDDLSSLLVTFFRGLSYGETHL